MAKHFGFINGEGQTIDYMASSDTEKAAIQANLNRWLGTPRCSDATQRASWEAYRDTLSALDLSSTTTTFPITGNCSLKTLVDNGDLAEYKNIQRLP